MKRFMLPLLFVLPLNAYAQIEFVDNLDGLTEQEKAWLEGDAPMPNSTEQVNDGELTWLPFPLKTSGYHLHNQMTISPDSLETGWMGFVQCHYNIDPIAKVEVLYRQSSVQNLKVISFKNIYSAETKSHSVVISQVAQGAEICISGESKTLRESADGWEVHRGPYMRKFFDGFYPMRVSEELDWSTTDLVFEASAPSFTTGYQQQLDHKHLKTSYYFEGVLMSQYLFKANSE